jgi:hypothetical protein
MYVSAEGVFSSSSCSGICEVEFDLVLLPAQDHPQACPMTVHGERRVRNQQTSWALCVVL